MWARNLLFIVLVLAGAGFISRSLLRRDRIATPELQQETSSVAARTGESAEPANEGFETALEQLNAEFQKHWEEVSIGSAPLAPDLAVARRLSLALVGTSPSLEEVRAIEDAAADAEVDLARWWADHLLADRRFSDYWAERLARIYVGNDNGPFVVFRRRRFTLWLSDQLQANTPYNQIVQKLIAEEGIWTGQPATNFITATANPNSKNQPDPIRLAGRTSRAFLGMRIDCLQCHEDKLGSVLVGSPADIHSGTQADFHQLAAFFGSAEITLVGVHDRQKPYEYQYLKATKQEVVPPKVPFGDEFADGHGKRRDQLARWVTHPNNKPFARATVNRAWALMFGKPLVEPIDDIPLVGIYPPGLQFLADDFVSHGYDLKRLIRLIVASDAFQRDSRADFEITERHESAWAVFPLTRLRPEQFAGSLVQAASLTTIDADAHVLVQLAKFGQTRDFVERFGDLGEDEFTAHAATIPQRLLMMNGNLVKERTGNNPVNSASTRIGMLTGKPEKQVEAAYLAILTRRPTADEQSHFVARLNDRQGQNRAQAMEDFYWTLINSTEFSWNH